MLSTVNSNIQHIFSVPPSLKQFVIVSFYLLKHTEYVDDQPWKDNKYSQMLQC